MSRVSMASSATSGTALVPEAQVERFKALGWRLVEEKPKSAPRRSRKKTDDSDDE